MLILWRGALAISLRMGNLRISCASSWCCTQPSIHSSAAWWCKSFISALYHRPSSSSYCFMWLGLFVTLVLFLLIDVSVVIIKYQGESLPAHYVSFIDAVSIIWVWGLVPSSCCSFFALEFTFYESVSLLLAVNIQPRVWFIPPHFYSHNLITSIAVTLFVHIHLFQESVFLRFSVNWRICISKREERDYKARHITKEKFHIWNDDEEREGGTNNREEMKINKNMHSHLLCNAGRAAHTYSSLDDTKVAVSCAFKAVL